VKSILLTADEKPRERSSVTVGNKEDVTMESDLPEISQNDGPTTPLALERRLAGSLLGSCSDGITIQLE
jgi:hypothetical protein